MHILIPFVIGFFVPPEQTIQEYGLNETNWWSNPSILPCRLDVNWSKYFQRIGNWGKIDILFVSDEQKKREYKTVDQFIALIDTPDMLQIYEKYQVEQSNIHKFEIWNKYSKNGREYKDIIQINVHLASKLQKGLGWWQKIF